VAPLNSLDNIMEAVRLLDLEAQPFTEVKSEDLVMLVNEITRERLKVRQLKTQITGYEIRLSNAISDGLKAMSKHTPRLDVRG